MSISYERQEALKILLRVQEEGAYSSILLAQTFQAHPHWLSRSKALITNLVYTVLTHDLRLECMVDLYSKVPCRKMEPAIACILKMSCAQLLFMDKIPENAVVHEAVEMAKLENPRLGGYVNAVLREILRNKKRESWPEVGEDLIAHLSVRCSIPRWILEQWQKDYGIEKTRKIALNLCASRGISIRVNTLKISPEALTERLSDRFEVLPGMYCREALRIVHGNPAATEEFEQGLFTIQDESSMLAVYALAPEKGERVLDLCSAPGGKATHMAQFMENEGLVCARDLYPQKIRLIRQNADRLGTSIVEAQKKDASVFDDKDEQAWDRVLLDAPCSGLGILRNKPDLKIHASKEKQSELAVLSRQLLENAARCVRKGGVLVFSTCTLNSEENEKNVERFLADHPEFHSEALSGILPEKFPKEDIGSCGTYVWPQKEALDGFFLVRLRKSE